ncbi:nematocyst expressed protein 3-like [Triplophysa dalaica]|uniref:nematocyst expressed protein 3-like n=1 Tax=Triplophysa dalaica TaxID=1582913 RepID=UPI0024DFDCCA|nr:nematocyst expressed protein 3-like [Triplophysa dalaica]XP_056603473.1 nematocyst expressed protein 3-like [Triplophysa dalaica]
MAASIPTLMVASPIIKGTASPEPTRKMATNPEPTRKMAASPEPAPMMAASPEPAPKMAASPEPARKMAVSPEAARKIVVSSEAARKIVVSPEAACKMVASPMTTRKMAVSRSRCLVSSPAEAHLSSVRRAGVPKAQSPVVPEVAGIEALPFESALLVVVAAFECLWAVHCSPVPEAIERMAGKIFLRSLFQFRWPPKILYRSLPQSRWLPMIFLNPFLGQDGHL